MSSLDKIFARIKKEDEKRQQNIQKIVSKLIDDSNNAKKKNKELNKLLESTRNMLHTGLSHINRKVPNETKKRTGSFKAAKNEKQLKCDICNKTYETHRGLKAHINLQHNDNELLKCKFCTNKYIFIKDRKNHQRKHKAVGSDKEPSVTSTTAAAAVANNGAIATITNSSTTMPLKTIDVHKALESLLCTKCGHQFSTIAKFSEHLNHHIRDNIADIRKMVTGDAHCS